MLEKYNQADTQRDKQFIESLEEEQKSRFEKIMALILVYWATKKNKRDLYRKIDIEIDNLLRETHKDLERELSKRHLNNYLYTLFLIQGIKGYKEIDSLKELDMKWHIGGKSYIDDLTYYSQKTKHDLKVAIEKGSIFNEDTKGITNLIEKPLESLNRSLKSLADTELAYAERQGQKDAYEVEDIKEYTFRATLDTKTCSTCGDLDGKTFKLSQAEVGVNYPPMHPHCRCYTVAKISETRIARDESNENVFVPGKMTYNEWKKEYAKS